jgi:F-type H+-transporting ATPase subunit b
MLDIQPSLLFFEIAIFLSLIAILNKVYFSPVLKFMDSRNETLNAETNSVGTIAKELEDLELEANGILSEAKAKSSSIRGEVIAAAKAESENIIKDAKKEASSLLQAFKKELDVEKETLKSVIQSNSGAYKEAIRNSITR